MSAEVPEPRTADHELFDADSIPVEQIPVFISYEIIKLFSEGLYQSPQKAIEELVSNGYDADASIVHVILPQQDSSVEPLWVIDNGHGMDSGGFAQLWRVADSEKSTDLPQKSKRPPIGQFGIGKLAAYVLAWRLTHISCVDGRILLTSMNFRRLVGRHQHGQVAPLDLSLRELTEDQAKAHFSDLKNLAPSAWEMMFGESRSPSWTVAELSDFKNLYNKLSAGRLEWVLSSGLPLESSFQVWLNGKKLESSKQNLEILDVYTVGGSDDELAKLPRFDGFETTETGIRIPGLAGEVQGIATIYKKRLTEGKSDRVARSHGFFVKVRNRVINLEDELFGLPALNHAVWSRFHMVIYADGLRDHLLSSREGVRESDSIRNLRLYLHEVFNYCRRKYEETLERSQDGLDLDQLLNDAPSSSVVDPLVEGVRRAAESGQESYYLSPPDLPEGTDIETWLPKFAADAAAKPFARVLFEATGVYDRVVRYIPEKRILVVNIDHPFIAKLIETGKSRAPAAYFGSSELLVDLLLQDHGFSRSAIIDFLIDRDRVLRLVAGDEPSTASEILRLLKTASGHEHALEKAVGLAFRVLGFEYERRGGNKGGPDGVLYARLGRGIASLADYRVVYDSKQTNSLAVAASKVKVDSLEDFRRGEQADFGFFLAVGYDAQDDPEAKLNREVLSAVEKGARVTLLRLDDLRRIVELHYQYGVTLTQLRSLFEDAHTVPEVKNWIQKLEHELQHAEPQVPLQGLLECLEDSKDDALARPNVYSVRMLDPRLKRFTPERLVACLNAVQTIIGSRWIEVEQSGEVLLHGTAGQIVAEMERRLRDLLGVDSMERKPVK